MANKPQKPCLECGFLNPKKAKFCMDCGNAYPSQLTALRFEDELKLVTILFADIKGFTQMSTRFAPDTIKEIMDQCFEFLTRHVVEESGTVLKYEGDSLMAVFGMQDGSDTAPLFSCYSALKMQTSLREFSVQLKADKGIDFSMRVGIHLGKVVRGAVGGHQDILGDAVNIAKRMEQNAPEGQIMVTHELASQLRGRFTLESQGAIQVKGKEEAVKCSLVLGKASCYSRKLFCHEVSLFERVAEQAEIQKCFDESRTELSPRIVLVESEAGIGKSKLIRGFIDHLVQKKDPFLFGQCLYNSTVSSDFRVFKVLFYNLEIQDQDSLLRRLAYDDFHQDGDVLKYNSALICHLLGFKYKNPESLEHLKESEKIRIKAFQAMARWFEVVSLKTPVIIMIDDMHWADESSLKLMDYMLENVKGPLFFLCAGRPIRLAKKFTFQSRRGRRIDLKALSTDQTIRFIRHIMLDMDSVPITFVEDLACVSQGNPLFVEEFLLHCKNKGVFSYQGEWVYDSS